MTIPTLSIYPANSARRSNMAAIVCPGGGYNVLSIDAEGYDVTRWLNHIGVTAALLKYRLRPYPENSKVPVPLVDLQRAIRIMRSKAGAYGYSPAKVGVIGFSAGGNLAVWAATVSDAGKPRSTDPVERQGCRPDFTLPIYPYVDDKQAAAITPDSPPAFIVQTADDFIVESSVRYFSAARKVEAPVELHFFDHGGHGYGLGIDGGPVSEWPRLAERWLSEVVEPMPDYKPVVQRRVPLEKGFHKRINCGAVRSWQDSRGHIWEPDAALRSDGGKVNRGPIAISSTTMPELYRTERYDLSALRIPAPAGRYLVRLHFCETFEGVTGRGQRRFRVSLNGRVVLNRFDPWHAASDRPHRAVVKQFEVASKGEGICVEFSRQGKSGPLINAVEVHGA